MPETTETKVAILEGTVRVHDLKIGDHDKRLGTLEQSDGVRWQCVKTLEDCVKKIEGKLDTLLEGPRQNQRVIIAIVLTAVINTIATILVAKLL
jgi:hypothetical protein